MAETNVGYSPGAGALIDTFNSGAGSSLRQVVVLGDSVTTANVVSITAAGALTIVAVGNTTSTRSDVASAASDTSILASNAARRGAMIYNDSTAVLSLLLNSGTSSATNFSLKIAAGGYYEVPFSYTGAIKGIWASANGSARVTEVTA